MSHRQACEYLVQICRTYGDLHRHFMQLLMKCSYLEVSQISNVIVQICRNIDDVYKKNLKELKNLTPEENTQVLDAFYEATNIELNPLGMYINNQEGDNDEADCWVLASYGNLRGEQPQQEEAATIE